MSFLQGARFLERIAEPACDCSYGDGRGGGGGGGAVLVKDLMRLSRKEKKISTP